MQKQSHSIRRVLNRANRKKYWAAIARRYAPNNGDGLYSISGKGKWVQTDFTGNLNRLGKSESLASYEARQSYYKASIKDSATSSEK